MGKFDNYINVTAPLHSATTKGKLGNANEIFLEGDTKNIENEIKEINSRHENLNKKHDALNSKHESLSKTVQGIAITGGASTATNVTYDNNASGLNAENTQDAIDELSSISHFVKRGGVVNISTNYNSEHTAEVLTLTQALSKVPSTDRVLGFQGKYLASDGWHTIIYIGDSLTSWSDTTKWRDLNVVDSINQLGALEQIGSITFKAEQTNNISFNMLLNLKEKTKKGKSVLLCIESDVDIPFAVFQRKGNSNVKSEDGYFITNRYYKFEIADDSVDKFFTYTNGVNALGSSYKAKLILLNDAFCSMYDEINDLQEVLFDKYVSVLSINSGDSGSINKSILFFTDLKKGDLVSYIIKADNISKDARINIRQRKGTTNITDLVEIEFNKEYIFEIADDLVDRFYLSNAANLAPNVSILSIVKKKSEYDSRYLSVLSKLDTHDLSIETNAKDIQQNKDNISNLKEIVNNLQPLSTTNVSKSFLEKSYAFGNSINLDGVIGNECTLKIFGGLDTITQQGNNLLYITDKSVTNNGLTISAVNNIINVTGTPTGIVSYALLKFTLNKGTYSFYATIEGDISDTNWTGLHIRISHAGLTKLDGSALTDNVIISSYSAKTYKVTSDNTVITLYVYCGASTVINGTAQIKVMVNSGETILPWEEPSQQRNINFNVKSPLTIYFGEDNIVANISKDYGLAVIPVTPTSSTESEQSIATYSNGDGDCYIADSIEYENGKLQYIQRIGKKVYSTGDTINEPYLSESSLGLSEGYNVYYVLEEPIVEDLSITPQSLYDGEIISTNNENAYMYCTYYSVKDINKENIVISRILAKYFPETNGIESSLIDNNLLFIGSWQGDISRIDITNIFSPTIIRLQNNNGYIVRELLSSDDYLFAICRDPASATVVTDGLEYGKGLLQVIDKNTLEVKKNIKLKNKGTGGKIYGDYLYVMEQMWDMAVYSLKVLKDDSVLGENVKPIFQLNLDAIAGNAVQWTLGEYQRIDFWYNSVEKKHYAIISAFDGGIHLFDVTNLVTMPSNATNDSEQGTFETDQDWTTFTNAREITRIGGVKANFGTGTNRNQVFGVVADYPYAYLTSAPSTHAYKYAKSVVRGIITIDISDMSKYKVLKDETNEQSYQWNRLAEFPKGTILDICNIPYEDWSPHINEGDLHPSRILKIGDALITNNGKNGVALYRIKNGIPSFDKNIYLGGSRVTALSMSNSNSIIAIPYQSGTNRLTTLFNIGNVNY